MSVQSQFRKYLRSYPEWRFRPPHVQVKRSMQKLGSDYGGYFVDRSMIPPEAAVYSVGIGKDITFDLSLIESAGVEIQAFDPTPTVKKWIASQSLPPEFHFHETGIAGFDGEAAFYPPPKEDWVSHSMIPLRRYRGESIRVAMIRLGTAMRSQGHNRIDVLKMDIEGAEYAVIEDLVRERIPVRQLLVEFHHALLSGGIEKTRETLALLDAYGMKIAHVCPRMEVFTLILATEETGPA